MQFINRAAELVVKNGGSLSGEHGDGQSRGALLNKMYGDKLVDVFRQFKSIWDPEWKMNPGKVVDPYPPDANLKWSPENYHPAAVETYFRYPQDQGSFAKAANRCVGVGKCRREGGGTMCPSYMVTREEIHSTRGRARLLYEMLEGDVVADGWRDEHVFEALDLCLACKGCRNECPVNVDMATYKAEFLSHYYAGRLRPRTAYTMGLVYWWARLASLAPGMANFFSQTWPFSALMKLAAGVAPERPGPVFGDKDLCGLVPCAAARRPATGPHAQAESRAGSVEPRGRAAISIRYIRRGEWPELQRDGRLEPPCEPIALSDAAGPVVARHVYEFL